MHDGGANLLIELGMMKLRPGEVRSVHSRTAPRSGGIYAKTHEARLQEEEVEEEEVEGSQRMKTKQSMISSSMCTLPPSYLPLK